MANLTQAQQAEWERLLMVASLTREELNQYQAARVFAVAAGALRSARVAKAEGARPGQVRIFVRIARNQHRHARRILAGLA